MTHVPLHLLHAPGPVTTAGRLATRDGRRALTNAHASVALLGSGDARPDETYPDGTLVRVTGRFDGTCLHAERLEPCHTPSGPAPVLGRGRALSLGAAVEARATMNERIRRFFAERDFLEVETPGWVDAPGTDIYLAPFVSDFAALPDDPRTGRLRGYLHTSPEFAMKRLLTEGFERIYQLTRVWRNGEVTDRHNPEFTILEWYRAWEPVDAIIDEVEALTRLVLDERRPFVRKTMQEVVDEACGFDLLDALDLASLRDACRARALLPPRSLERERWDELFFELVVTHIDPYLATLGAVFVTEWPTPLAVLARRKPSDPRVAERFELYIDGVELANGFGELTDATEQRARFEEDLADRRALGLPALPMPTRLLEALEYGMPPSSGVAMGVDRLLMLATAAPTIRDVAPFALARNPDTGDIER